MSSSFFTDNTLRFHASVIFSNKKQINLIIWKLIRADLAWNYHERILYMIIQNVEKSIDATNSQFDWLPVDKVCSLLCILLLNVCFYTLLATIYVSRISHFLLHVLVTESPVFKYPRFHSTLRYGLCWCRKTSRSLRNSIKFPFKWSNFLLNKNLATLLKSFPRIHCRVVWVIKKWNVLWVRELWLTY